MALASCFSFFPHSFFLSLFLSFLLLFPPFSPALSSCFFSFHFPLRPLLSSHVFILFLLPPPAPFSTSCFSFYFRFACKSHGTRRTFAVRLPRNFTVVLIPHRAEVLSETKPRVASNRQRNAAFFRLRIDQRRMQTILSRPGSNDFRPGRNFGCTATRPPRSTAY